MKERRAPVQGDWNYGLSLSHPRHNPNAKPPGTISWTEHLQVFEAYAEKHGRDQSAEKIAERAGFGYAEATSLLGRDLLTWRKR